MGPRLAASLLVATLTLAGCVGGGASLVPNADLPALDLLASPESLWRDPQNAAHPAFNYPTLSNPAVGESVPAWWLPIDPAVIPDVIKGVQHLASAPEGVVNGGGIAIFGRIMVVPGFFSDTTVIDISDPSKPALLSTIEGRHRGAAFIPYPDGRLVTLLATSAHIESWDVTDPTLPVQLPTLEPDSGSHKVGVVPGTPIVYNANSNGAGSGIEIFDLTDPQAPVLVQVFESGFGCHHVYFWIDASQEKYRSTCAGIESTVILDIADPRAPEIVSTLRHPMNVPGPVPSNVGAVPVTFSHFSILNDDGTVLIVGDETGGGPAPGCDVHVETPAKSVSGPLGNLWFYDVKDEKNPRLMGWFNPGNHFAKNPPQPSTSPTKLLFGGLGCTAHHGRLVPDPEEKRDLLVMAFYGAGVILVDFTDPANPKMVDQWADRTNVWEAWYYNGYIFTGDLNRGMDVLTLR